MNMVSQVPKDSLFQNRSLPPSYTPPWRETVPEIWKDLADKLNLTSQRVSEMAQKLSSNGAPRGTPAFLNWFAQTIKATTIEDRDRIRGPLNDTVLLAVLTYLNHNQESKPAYGIDPFIALWMSWPHEISGFYANQEGRIGIEIPQCMQGLSYEQLTMETFIERYLASVPEAQDDHLAKEIGVHPRTIFNHRKGMLGSMKEKTFERFRDYFIRSQNSDSDKDVMRRFLAFLRHKDYLNKTMTVIHGEQTISPQLPTEVFFPSEFSIHLVSSHTTLTGLDLKRILDPSEEPFVSALDGTIDAIVLQSLERRYAEAKLICEGWDDRARHLAESVKQHKTCRQKIMDHISGKILLTAGGVDHMRRFYRDLFLEFHAAHIEPPRTADPGWAVQGNNLIVEIVPSVSVSTMGQLERGVEITSHEDCSGYYVRVVAEDIVAGDYPVDTQKMLLRLRVLRAYLAKVEHTVSNERLRTVYEEAFGELPGNAWDVLEAAEQAALTWVPAIMFLDPEIGVTRVTCGGVRRDIRILCTVPRPQVPTAPSPSPLPSVADEIFSALFPSDFSSEEADRPQAPDLNRSAEAWAAILQKHPDLVKYQSEIAALVLERVTRYFQYQERFIRIRPIASRPIDASGPFLIPYPHLTAQEQKDVLPATKRLADMAMSFTKTNDYSSFVDSPEKTGETLRGIFHLYASAYFQRNSVSLEQVILQVLGTRFLNDERRRADFVRDYTILYFNFLEYLGGGESSTSGQYQVLRSCLEEALSGHPDHSLSDSFLEKAKKRVPGIQTREQLTQRLSDLELFLKHLKVRPSLEIQSDLKNAEALKEEAVKIVQRNRTDPDATAVLARYVETFFPGVRGTTMDDAVSLQDGKTINFVPLSGYEVAAKAATLLLGASQYRQACLEALLSCTDTASPEGQKLERIFSGRDQDYSEAGLTQVLSLMANKVLQFVVRKRTEVFSLKPRRVPRYSQGQFTGDLKAQTAGMFEIHPPCIRISPYDDFIVEIVTRHERVIQVTYTDRDGRVTAVVLPATEGQRVVAGARSGYSYKSIKIEGGYVINGIFEASPPRRLQEIISCIFPNSLKVMEGVYEKYIQKLDSVSEQHAKLFAKVYLGAQAFLVFGIPPYEVVRYRQEEMFKLYQSLRDRFLAYFDFTEVMVGLPEIQRAQGATNDEFADLRFNRFDEDEGSSIVFVGIVRVLRKISQNSPIRRMKEYRECTTFAPQILSSKKNIEERRSSYVKLMHAYLSLRHKNPEIVDVS